MYPFSNEAKKLWKKIKISDLNEIIIEYSITRIIDTVRNPKDVEVSPEKELYLYPLIKILLSKKPSILRKFAEREKERVFYLLKNLDDEEVFSIFSDIFDCYYDDDFFYVDVIDYIKKTEGLNRRSVLDGNVIIKKYEIKNSFKRISEEIIYSICNHIYLILKDPINEIPSGFESYINMFNNMFFEESKELDFVKLPFDIDKLPPCIKKIYFDLINGEKVPHMARFVIATFLINIGLEKEKIVDLFRNQENFNEKRTLYHIEYLMGEKGCGKRRMCPNCDKIKEYGLCFSDCGVKNPLVLYNRNLKSNKN